MNKYWVSGGVVTAFAFLVFLTLANGEGFAALVLTPLILVFGYLAIITAYTVEKVLRSLIKRGFFKTETRSGWRYTVGWTFLAWINLSTVMLSFVPVRMNLPAGLVILPSQIIYLMMLLPPQGALIWLVAIIILGAFLYYCTPIHSPAFFAATPTTIIMATGITHFGIRGSISLALLAFASLTCAYFLIPTAYRNRALHTGKTALLTCSDRLRLRKMVERALSFLDTRLSKIVDRTLSFLDTIFS